MKLKEISETLIYVTSVLYQSLPILGWVTLNQNDFVVRVTFAYILYIWGVIQWRANSVIFDFQICMKMLACQS